VKATIKETRHSNRDKFIKDFEYREWLAVAGYSQTIHGYSRIVPDSIGRTRHSGLFTSPPCNCAISFGIQVGIENLIPKGLYYHGHGVHGESNE
jgi:hypothetical protein